MVGGLIFTLPVLLSVSCALQASDYFSDEYFPGLHLLDVSTAGVSVYKDCRRPTASVPPVVVSTGWKSMEEARASFEKALSVPPLEPLQTPWAFFDTQGIRLNSLPQLMQQKVAFILLIGQWMWPAVRIGFEQQAYGVLNGAPITLRTLSLRPVVFEVPGFILPEEADKIVEIGRSRNMRNSIGSLTSVDAVANRRHEDYRTSTQTWLSNDDALTVSALDQRTSNLTRVPASHNEPVQLLRYGENQFYHSHLDWTDMEIYNGQKDKWQQAHFGWEGRMATLFWYLNDVGSGGHTIFPKHNHTICNDYRESCQGSFSASPSDCNNGLKVPPKKGSVILWYNYHANGRGDQNALHGGCPPARGFEKWSGNKWIHIKSLNKPTPQWIPDHPALERFGWQVDAMERLAIGKKVDSTDACILKVKSEYKSDLRLVWVRPDSDGMQGDVVDIIRARGQTLMDSFKGHSFRLDSGKWKTRPFECKGDEITYRITKDMDLIVDEGSSEL